METWYRSFQEEGKGESCKVNDLCFQEKRREVIVEELLIFLPHHGLFSSCGAENMSKDGSAR